MKKVADRRNFDEERYRKNLIKRRIMAALTVTLLLPLIFCVFYFFLKQRHYMLMSLLVLATVILPFLLVFEYRKPKARDVVLISSMTALTVTANTACTHTVPLHAGTAMVIISGISFGPEAGFLVGALGRLVCNVFDGQGPWTPWQMVCWGLIGFLSGLAFNRTSIKTDNIFEESTTVDNTLKIIAGPVISVIVAELAGLAVYIIFGKGESISGYAGIWMYAAGAAGLLIGFIIQRKKLNVDLITMIVFTFIVCVIIYGGIMNFASLLMDAGMNPDSQEVSFETVKLVYITGIPYDIQHGLGASICIFFFGESLIKKLWRIKIKYGIML